MKKDEKTRVHRPKKPASIGIYAGGSIFNIPTLMLNSILERCRYYGISPVVEIVTEPGRLPDSLARSAVQAGIVFDDSYRCSDFQSMTDIPLMFTNTNDSDLPGSVVYDEKNAMKIAVEHFLYTGKKHIGYIFCTGDHYSIRERKKGLQEAAEENSLPDPVLFELDKSIWPGQSNRQIMELMKMFIKEHRKVNGFILFPDLLAPLLYKVIKQKNRKIPEDYGVIGFNNSELTTVIDPQLTCLWTGHSALGHMLVDRAFRIIQKGSIAVPEPYVVPYELIRRGSTLKKDSHF